MSYGNGVTEMGNKKIIIFRKYHYILLIIYMKKKQIGILW